LPVSGLQQGFNQFIYIDFLLSKLSYRKLGGPGALPPPGSRRPGLADFPHPVPRLTVSLCAVAYPLARHFVGFASYAIRSSFVEMTSGSVPRPSFPRTIPCADSPFPPQGRSGGYPCFFGTTSCYDSPPDFPLHFVVLRSAVPLASPGAADPTGSRRFLGSPMCTFAVLYDSVPFFALSLEGRPRRRELLFAGCLQPVPHSASRVAGSPPSQRVDVAPGLGRPKARE
jgi:hypothetical protein